MNRIFITIFLGYIFGCFQSSYFLGKIFKKIDIRTLGNGNAGASNATVSFGWKFGVSVAILDILKTIISTIIIRILFQNSLSEGNLIFLIYLNGLFVILGHNYPFYLNFKGGKGTASLVGLLFAINIKFGLLGILTMLIITIVTDYISLGTIGLVILFVLGSIYFKFNIYCIFISIFVAILSIYKHIPNIKNIISHQENGLRKALNKKEK